MIGARRRGDLAFTLASCLRYTSNLNLHDGVGVTELWRWNVTN
jgi:hypothetical protein